MITVRCCMCASRNNIEDKAGGSGGGSGAGEWR